jgi:putative SOS response-associated peptidase YedK
MCGRYRNLQTWADLHAALSRFLEPLSQPAPNLEPREQVRPTNDASVVRMIDGKPSVGNARWWLIPWFHRGGVKDWKATTFNARAETVATSRAYRDSFKRRRCLVVADGWYEWSGPREGDEKRKQPWLFTPRQAEPIMFAGIWDRCDTTDQGTIDSFTIVTQPAGAPLNGYHDRAPVILFGEEWSRWLDVDADVSDLLGPESRDRFDVGRCAIG